MLAFRALDAYNHEVFYTAPPGSFDDPQQTYVPADVRAALLNEASRHHGDPETVELVACRDKGEVKEIVKTHLATSVEDAPPVPKYNPTDL